MIGFPWFLLAGGIVIVLVGVFMGALSRQPAAKKPKIRRKMKDADIARSLNAREPIPAFSYVIAFGLLCILVSVCWRLAGRLVGLAR